MDLLDEEVLSLWKAFHENTLRYIMVGGFATNLHGHQRTTGDIDIWIEDSPENRRKLRKALKELELGDFESIERMDFVPGWSTVRLFSGLELDIMTYLKAFPQDSFETCFTMASLAEIEGIPVRFLHINHLIEEKTRLGREKDASDASALKRIRDLRDAGRHG